MEFRNIATFLKVVELASFSKAAEKLHYAQSTVTMQIQQLEKELGTKLFDRVGNGVLLTEKGQEFAFHAYDILSAVEKAVTSVKVDSTDLDKKNLIGKLFIGSVESIAAALLPDILLQFRDTCPKVETIVHIARRDTLIDEVHNNQIDLFFSLEKKRNVPGFKRVTLSKEEIIFIAPNNFNLAADEHIPLNKIVTMPFLLTEKGESYRYELDCILAEQDIEVNPVIEISNPETIVQLVEREAGVSFLPYFCCKKALEQETIKRINTTMSDMYMYSQLFYHKNKWLTPPMEIFISIAQEYFQSIS